MYLQHPSQAQFRQVAKSDLARSGKRRANVVGKIGRLAHSNA